MELITKAPKGTVDIIPGESEKWSLVEAVMTDEAELNGFSEIRTPVFEHTELFLRSVGDTTDVVEKQMYTFEDKGGRSITLRPEGTAGAVRAMLENGLYNGGYPVKLYYKTSSLPLRKAAGRPSARAASVRRGDVRHRRTGGGRTGHRYGHVHFQSSRPCR